MKRQPIASLALLAGLAGTTLHNAGAPVRTQIVLLCALAMLAATLVVAWRHRYVAATALIVLMILWMMR